jgi:hypothetical protein
MRYLTQELKKAIIDNNKESTATLKKVKKGIYLHVYTPSYNIYERRRNGIHTIKDGDTVIRPGKFTGTLYGRWISYYTCWKYTSNNEPCFFNEVKSYLIVDLSTYTNNYVARVEAALMSIVNQLFDNPNRYEKGSKSEYRLVNKGVAVSDDKILQFTSIINSQIENDMALEINNKLYKN